MREFNIVMKKQICLVLAIAFASILTYAQNPSGERRVYYLDATYSMVSNKLWQPSKDNLIKAIENVDDVNTELVVIVFADDRNASHKVWKKWEEKATDDGKSRLTANINDLPLPVKSSMTNLYDPLVDFYSEANSGKVNYMFLMTDGGHEQGGDFFRAIDQWGNRTGALTYGFFVELTDNVGHSEVVARDKARTHIDKQTEKTGRIWRVSSADVNINLIRLDQNAMFNVRNDEYIDIPIHFSGKNSSAINDLKFSFDEGSDFKVKKTDISKDNVRVYIKHDLDIYSYPVNSTATLNVSFGKNPDKTFLLTNKVKVHCLNKKERVLLFSKNKISGSVKHYDSFGWIKEKTIPCESTIGLSFSQDAKSDATTFVELIVTDNGGKKLSSSDIVVYANGEKCDKNKIRVSPKDDKIILSISFPEGAKNGIHQGYLTVGRNYLDRIDNVDLNATNNANVITWRVRYVQTMNPLAKLLMWIGIIVLSVLLLWFLVIKPVKYPRFPQFRKMVLVEKSGAVVAQFTTNFKGARRVVFASQKVKQTALNTLFTGRIDTIVNPIFEEPITFLPRKHRKAMAKGKGYIFNPNPIPQSGVAVITEPAKKLTINLQ